MPLGAGVNGFSSRFDLILLNDLWGAEYWIRPPGWGVSEIFLPRPPCFLFLNVFFS